MINIRATGSLDVLQMMRRINKKISGSSMGGRALVGPTKEAWYGQLHEFGLGKFPPRPFARPALLAARHAFPACFVGLMFAQRPALVKAALIVEREMKQLLNVGGGEEGTPSPAGMPPHTQSSTLKNSITYEIET